MYYTDLFRSNTTALNESTFDENDFPYLEGYDSEDGCLLVAKESCENMNIDFKDSMKHEFMEATLELKRSNGEYIEEGAWDKIKEKGSNIFAKLKEMIKKFAAKVYSIYTAAINKIESLFTSDYNKLFNKYKAKWESGKGTFKGYVTFRKPETSFKTGLKFSNAAGSIHLRMAKIIGSDDKDGFLEGLKDGSYMEELIKEIAPDAASKSDLRKELPNLLLGPKNKYKLDSDIIQDIEHTLSQKDIIKELKKSQKENMDACKKVIKSIGAAEKALKGKDKPKTAEVKDATGRSYNLDGKAIQCVKGMVSAFQTVMSITNNAYIKANKINIAQCKAVFVKVVGGVRSSEASDKVLNKESYNINDVIEAVAFDEVMADLA